MSRKFIDFYDDFRFRYGAAGNESSSGKAEGDMKAAIELMIKSNDLEVVLMGEHFASNCEYYINELQRLGFLRDEAEAGIDFYCECQALIAEMEGEVHFPDYREEIVQELAEFSRQWMIAG